MNSGLHQETLSLSRHSHDLPAGQPFNQMIKQHVPTIQEQLDCLGISCFFSLLQGTSDAVTQQFQAMNAQVLSVLEARREFPDFKPCIDFNQLQELAGKVLIGAKQVSLADSDTSGQVHEIQAQLQQIALKIQAIRHCIASSL